MHARTRVIVATTVLATQAAVPAWAHPGFQPAEVLAGERTEVELAIAHDCEAPGEGASPTTVVEVQIPDAIAEVEPLERDGWTLNLAGDADGSILRAEWTRDDGTTEAEPPTFRLLVTPVTQESATDIPWKVYQGCETGAYRWGAGSEDEPSVDLTVTPGPYTPPTTSPTSALTPSASPSVPASATPTTSAGATSTNADTSHDQGLGEEAATSEPPWILLATAAIGLVAAVGWLLRARSGRR